MSEIVKGDRVLVKWFSPAKAVSLAGMQPKFEVEERRMRGVVAHIRADSLDNPTKILVYVTPDAGWEGPTEIPTGCTCDKPHVAVLPDSVIAVYR